MEHSVCDVDFKPAYASHLFSVCGLARSAHSFNRAGIGFSRIRPILKRR